jgi:hypothetical protein
VRKDHLDHFKVVVRIAGELTFYQNDRAAQLRAGDVALIDNAQAMRCVTTQTNSPGSRCPAPGAP